jgi:hypothetical protein
MLGRSSGEPDLARCLDDHAAMWEGLDPATARRVGLVLARVTGIWRWLKAPLLQQAWCATLALWAAARLGEDEIATDDPETAIFAAICGRRARLAPTEAKRRDLVATWRATLRDLGIATT